MMRLLFQNSRLALAFVVLTVLGAVAMIGPQGNGGLVTRAVSLSESQRGLLSGDARDTAGSQGEAKAPPSVFGDYNPDTAASAAPAGPVADTGNPMTAPLSPTATIAPPGAASADPIIPENEAEQ
ncbi:hypothetical protein [Erythrobacter donghaensis]|uniref:hypothetical protein n=1 Tax=Erythrobacter donghaensis TaxID=267135 RepID=UPI0012D8ED5F|nr:hypothetical protein [Erythrobacter donghaensis]